MESDPINLINRQDQAVKRWGRRLAWQRKAKVGLLGFLFIFAFIILPWLFFFECLRLQEKSYYLVVAFSIAGLVLIGLIDRMAQQYRLKRLIGLLNDFVLIDDLCFYDKVDAAHRSWSEIANKLFGRSVFELLDELSFNPAIRKFHLSSPLPFTDISANYVFTLEYHYEQKQWVKS